MPRNIYTESVRVAGDADAIAGRGTGQTGWYAFAAKFLDGLTTLDVGAGTGRDAALLAAAASRVDRQDIDPQLEAAGVIVKPLSEFADNSYDVVTCIDVIEHVENDQAFLANLLRIARRKAFITTPLWSYGRAFWPYHVREYTFREFHSLTCPFGACTYFMGVGSGVDAHEVRDVEHAFFMERMINNDVTNLPARLLQKALPASRRHAGHQAVLIRLDDA